MGRAVLHENRWRTRAALVARPLLDSGDRLSIDFVGAAASARRSPTCRHKIAPRRHDAGRVWRGETARAVFTSALVVRGTYSAPRCFAFSRTAPARDPPVPAGRGRLLRRA